MKYILISDLEDPEEFDDALYVVKTRLTAGATEEETYELFSENDIRVIHNRRPPEADALVLTDDWMFWDTKKNQLLGYAFRY